MEADTPVSVDRRNYAAELIARMEELRPARKVTRSPLFTAWKQEPQERKREEDQARETWLKRHRERRREV